VQINGILQSTMHWSAVRTGSTNIPDSMSHRQQAYELQHHCTKLTHLQHYAVYRNKSTKHSQTVYQLTAEKYWTTLCERRWNGWHITSTAKTS